MLPAEYPCLGEVAALESADVLHEAGLHVPLRLVEELEPDGYLVLPVYLF